MRTTAIKVCLFLCAFTLLSTGKVSAISSKQLAVTDDPFHYVNQKLVGKEKPKLTEKKHDKPVKEKKAEPEEKALEPVTYTVISGDSLIKIAEAHQTEWKRLFAKNTEVANPDSISVGMVLTIPTADEQLPERAIPEVVVPVVSSSPARNTAPVRAYGGSSAGNTYAPGYCTWYAKSRRPDLPNRLGNASAWVANAAAQGFATGSAPRAGAIGQQGNHVVYVESVNGDGTVTISDMNYAGLYVVTTRTAPASSFRYIY